MQREIGEGVEALIVFTIKRHDLLDIYLSSIDSTTNHVFVIINYNNEEDKTKVLSVLRPYGACDDVSSGCKNVHVKQLHTLAFQHNVGYAGSVNMGIKVMLQYDFNYALFSGDDTRFLPGRLQAAKHIVESFKDVCVFHLEGYSCFALTKQGLKILGPMDENFWPAYSEDCDYWFRAILEGCKMFYRGGYSPERQTPQSLQNAFVAHGDDMHVGSVTHKSDHLLGKLVEGTLHATRGRFAYLVRKWGVETCSYYHQVINKFREDDEFIEAPASRELFALGAYKFPYNDSFRFPATRYWLRDDWQKHNAVSSRAVNSEKAPIDFVWQESDYSKIDALQSSLPHITAAQAE
mmetsp:Transcript_10269/g.28672  ORF Transcript_10269/g.28672 Transcript_10269/m.28672 type:complete len:349 (-) Transcript_10269:552-1598(-)